MPHYKDGTIAAIGDMVIGRGYNVPHVISGVVTSITAGEHCNVTVAYTSRRNFVPPVIVPWMDVEYGECSAFEKVG